MTARTTIQLRRGTAAQWTAANPTLAAGEFGVETDTGKRKVGDGSTAWASLPYSVLSNDSRLTDTRTPTDNSVTSAKIVDGAIVNADINASAAIDLSKLAAQADKTFVGNVSGGSAVPTAVTATNVIAALSGAAGASFSMNSQKITSLANGAATGNAATWDQTPAGIVTTKGDILSATGANAVQRNAVGSDGTVLTGDANSAGGVKWARQEMVLLKTGTYTGPTGVIASPITPTSGRAYYTPLILPRRTTFDRIAVNHVATTSATGTVELGVYSNSGDGVGSLLWSAGTVSTTSAAAFKTITISQTLDAGIYWVAALPVWTGSTPTFTGLTATHPLPFLPIDASASPIGLGGSLFENSLAALPSNASAGYSVPVTGIYVYLRVA